MQAIGWVGLLFLAVAGAVSIFGWGVGRMVAPARAIGLYLVPMRAEMQPLEQLLRWSNGCLRWDRWLKNGRLILLDLGIDAEQRQVVEAFCRDHRDVLLCTPEGLSALLAEDSVYKVLRVVLYW